MGFAAIGSLLLVTTARARPDSMVRVAPGTFTMGSEHGDPDERPSHPVTLPGYAIDHFEVTQARYAECVRAGVCRAAVKYPEADGPTLPAVGVSWLDAERYCRWTGKRLPTEAEWERAARGTDGRTYPWGAGLDCARANFGNFAGDGPCARVNPGRVLPVGSRPTGQSPEGAEDMAGNVWEWVADVYAPYGQGQRPSTRAPAADAPRVVRGGSCCSYFAMPTTTNRLSFPPTYADRDLGFRCAR
jgi:formylglycine-generating enzyme required for sulfatase activity